MPYDLCRWGRSRWVDESNRCGGPASIDIWYGQRLTQAQYQRVSQYIDHADFSDSNSLPEWVHMFMWFFGHPGYTERHNLDFNFEARVSESFQPSWVHRTCWQPPFERDMDEGGMDLHTRLRKREDESTEYDTYTVVQLLEPEVLEGLRESGCVSYGRDSCRYPNLDLGASYVKVGESDQGWWWVYPAVLPSTKYGWADPTCFKPTGDKVVLARIQPGVYTSHETAIVPYRLAGLDVQAGAGMPRLLERVPSLAAYGGFDRFMETPQLAVCFSGASMVDRRGFPVSWHVGYPPS